MATDKLLGAISLCRRAGKLVAGRDAAEKSCSRGECDLLLTASGLAPRSLAQAQRVAQTYEVPHIAMNLDMQSLSVIFGGKQTGILAVCDKNFARMIKNAAQNGEHTQSQLEFKEDIYK